jgi:hypothetical protein
MGPESADPAHPAWYLYGLVAEPRQAYPGLSGLDGAQVRVLPVGGLEVLAHACRPVAYASADRDTVLAWVQAHAAVLADALERYRSVVPFAFNTIVRGLPDGEDPLDAWMAGQQETFERLLGRVRDRIEFGVHLTATLPPRGPQPAIDLPDSVPPGVAYLLQTRRPSPPVWPEGWQGQAAACARELQAHSEEVVARTPAQPPAASPGASVTLLRAACLVRRDGAGAFLDGVRSLDTPSGFGIEVTGPWPAYSFLDPLPRQAEIG